MSQPPMGGQSANTPLDSAVSTGAIGAARLFSHVISPPVVFAGVGLALAWRAVPGWGALPWAALYGFWISLAPILFVVYLLRTGRISDISMTKKERRIPYIVGVVCAMITYGLLRRLDGPASLQCLTVFNIVALAVLGAINWAWQISHHATAITAAAWLTVAVFGGLAGWLMIALAAVVCANRLYLRRHTPAQLLAGIVWGAVAMGTLVQVGCLT